MKVLGIDCAGTACSVALLTDEAVLGERSVMMERGQAEALLPMISSVLDAARTDLAALDRIAVTVGPGSFTGLRTGLSAARGLALARSLPITGVTSFDAAAEAVADLLDGAPLVVALESKRVELYLQIFDKSEARAPALVAPDAWAGFVPPGPFHLTGDGAPRLAAALGRSDVVVTPARWSHAVAAARLARLRPATAAPPHPLYLRAPDVTLPARRETAAQ